MTTACTVYVNNGVQDDPLGTSGATFTEVDLDNDELILSAGSNVIKDGEVIAGDSSLTQAGVLLTGVEQTIDKYLLSDASAGIYKEIVNMGADNKRYVLAFDFDDETASEPVLELWDDTNLDSIDFTSLGAGIASASWWRGITTTSALPGVAWTGSRLAGSSDGNFLWLNNQNGPLTTADTLYCQLKVVIPSTQQDAGNESPLIVIKYATV